MNSCWRLRWRSKAASLTLACFLLRDCNDEGNRTLLERLSASGKLYLTHTVLDGKGALQMSIGGR